VVGAETTHMTSVAKIMIMAEESDHRGRERNLM